MSMLFSTQHKKKAKTTVKKNVMLKSNDMEKRSVAVDLRPTSYLTISKSSLKVHPISTKESQTQATILQLGKNKTGNSRDPREVKGEFRTLSVPATKNGLKRPFIKLRAA
jgi:hypothetical protein